MMVMMMVVLFVVFDSSFNPHLQLSLHRHKQVIQLCLVLLLFLLFFLNFGQCLIFLYVLVHFLEEALNVLIYLCLFGSLGLEEILGSAVFLLILEIFFYY